MLSSSIIYKFIVIYFVILGLTKFKVRSSSEAETQPWHLIALQMLEESATLCGKLFVKNRPINFEPLPEPQGRWFQFA